MGEALLPDLSNLTATAVLGWYAWHTASKTAPALIDAFREEMAATRSDGRAEREALLEELSAEREQRHDDHVAIVSALHELTERLRGKEEGERMKDE